MASEIILRSSTSTSTTTFKPLITQRSIISSTISTNMTKLHQLDLSGIFPPIATPFDAEENISYAKLKENFVKWNKIPFRGYVVLGSNGESVALNMEEKLTLLKTVRSLSQPSHLLIAGTGCQGTRETIEFCSKVAEDKSADAVLVITPSYFKDRMTDLALKNHFTAVADKSPLPVILYNVPKNTNLDMSAEVVAELSQHPNIIGLKDSGGDITKIGRIVHLTKGNNFQVIAGSAGFLLPGIVTGCVGGICALANILGQETCDLYQLAKNTDLAPAVALQQRLIYLNLLVTGKFGVPGLKAAMDLCGYYGGPPRQPLLSLEPANKEHLQQSFKKENMV